MSDASVIDTPAGPAILRRSSRRTLAISVLPDGSLDLVAPLDGRVSDIAAKVGKRLRWIVRQRNAFSDMHRNRVPLRYQPGATHTYLGRQYRLKVTIGSTPGVRLAGAYFHVTAKAGGPDEIRRLLEYWMREKAIQQFTKRLAKWNAWCAHRQLPSPRLRILKMPKRWGSAGAGGKIALNPALVSAPSICIDYVIAHEVCHLAVAAHDKAFYRLLDQVCPDWKRLKARLEQL